MKVFVQTEFRVNNLLPEEVSNEIKRIIARSLSRIEENLAKEFENLGIYLGNGDVCMYKDKTESVDGIDGYFCFFCKGIEFYDTTISKLSLDECRCVKNCIERESFLLTSVFNNQLNWKSAIGKELQFENIAEPINPERDEILIHLATKKW